MISVKNNVFYIHTPNTTYAMRVMPSGHLQHLYYGAKIDEYDNVVFLADKQSYGTAIGVGDNEKTYDDTTCFETSTMGRGDYRESMVIIADQEDNTVNEFLYKKHQLLDGFETPNLPNSHGKSQTLAITLVDDAKHLTLTLYYSIFDDCDVLVKSASVTNDGKEEVRLLRVMSNQLDLPSDEFVLDTLDGAWARERYINSSPLHCGVTKIDSKRGISSNQHNPFVVIKSPNCNCDNGEAYGFNLVYSGNHAEYFDKTPLNKVRVLTGINDSAFCWHLGANQTFYTPEATLCFSNGGTNQLSQRYHHFVNSHIVPTQWAYKPRPILINNWEATYFKFTEEKLLSLAKKAKSVGIELFVLDDGWFGDRTNDTKGLGDWTENPERLPNGLAGLCKKINEIGLQFGVWVEPEMVNPDSNLYRAHPEWAVAHPSYQPRLWRNQMCLDLTNDEVCNYVIDSMTKIFSTPNLAYVKWDYNRPVTDCYSPTLKGRQGEFFHRYAMGISKIMSTLTSRFPHILFESCASGGNRSDLGTLCYMPQFWCSDNTDSYDRVRIQEGTLYGYPQSCIGAHVSASPNHQTLRTSPIDNRFNTACMGAFGYELDLTSLDDVEIDSIKKQVEWYKKYRQTLQFGQYHKLQSVFDKGNSSWVITNQQKTQAVANVTNGIAKTLPPQEFLRVPTLDEQSTYMMQTRQQKLNYKMFGGLVDCFVPQDIKGEKEVFDYLASIYPLDGEKETYALSGKTLACSGVKLNQQWSSGFDENTRVMLDFGSRLYSFDKIEE